jgi:hypothetical protein
VFLDVFPDDLPGIPPERVIEFKIELQPSTAPIAKAPYKMSPVVVERVEGSTTRSIGQKLYSPKHITLGLSGIICDEER